MKDAREKLMSHILMVVAPLLVLLMITVAWFVSSRTIALSEMSFATQNSGPGAVLYPYKTLGKRTYSKTSLTYDQIIWGEKLAPEDSAITIENMLPGQCEYYLLVSETEFTPRLTGITLADDESTSTPQLRECLGFYLRPTKIDLTQNPLDQIDIAVSLSLSRESPEAGGRLTDALLKDWTTGDIVLTKPADDNGKTAYILAVFCDPIYGQNGPDAMGIHKGTLPGTISFSLAFDKTEAP